MDETWDLWYPDAGATGISFCRSRVDADAAGDRVLVHAAPRSISVTVTGQDGRILAEGNGLERTDEGPMSYLIRAGDRITIEDVWPTDDDLGRLVLLPGGEAGKLVSWWHADDHSEWRWRVEFHNRR